MKRIFTSFAVIAALTACAHAEPPQTSGETSDVAVVGRPFSSDLIVKKSAHSVDDTLDRLTSTLVHSGITVFARINHGTGAANAGLDLRPTQLLIFGNPKLGGPLMQADQRIGLDLPLKVLAWEDADGKVWLGYQNPGTLKLRYGLTEQDEIFSRMAGALKRFTDAAAAAE